MSLLELAAWVIPLCIIGVFASFPLALRLAAKVERRNCRK